MHWVRGRVEFLLGALTGSSSLAREWYAAPEDKGISVYTVVVDNISSSDHQTMFSMTLRFLMASSTSA